MLKRRSFFVATVLCTALTAAYPQAQPAAPAATAAAQAPLADYLKLPQYSRPRLSPDGRYLAVATPVNGRLNLAVVDLETRKGTAITNVSNFDVIDAHWVGNERLVFTLGQQNTPTGPDQLDGGGLFVVSRDGKQSRTLAPTLRETGTTGAHHYRGLDFIRRVPGSDDEILAEGNERSKDSADVYRVNVVTGRRTLVSNDRPAYTVGFVLDDKLVPRVARSWVKDTSVFITWYRASAEAPWVELVRTDQSTGEIFDPAGFLADNKTLLVASNRGRDTTALFRYDPETKTFGDIVAQDPRFDLDASSAILEPDTDRLKGVQLQAEKPRTTWLDEKEARTQRLIDGALPGVQNNFARFPNSGRLLVTSYSDVSPARYYLLDEEKKTLEELFSSKPWLGKDQLVEMRPFVLKTRDGLEIPSYYFLPKGYKAGDKLPTVLHIHGGPEARADVWGRGFGYGEAQLLASRGYAVVLPNFRVTPGFGTKVRQAGFGTVGRQMSDDHEDAARWAIAQGFADPARICISGASYGGYAVMVAMAKAPDLFRCGVSGLMVSDWDMIVSSVRGGLNPAQVEYTKRLLGENASARTAMRDNSPVNMAARIKGPVFVYAGADDTTAPLEQTQAMVRALERAGNAPKVVVVKDGEGHGFGKVENNIDLYEKMLKFLDEQIGPQAK